MRVPAGRRALGLGLIAPIFTLVLAACGEDERVPAPVPEGASAVAINTEDGVTLDARLFAADPRRLVVLLHAYPGDQRDWFEFARELHQRGISVLTLDFRGYGGSEGDQDGARADRDARAAVRFARERGYELVVVVGASMGGSAAIVAAASEPVDGLVALSAPERFRGMDAGHAVIEGRYPLLIVAARGDTSAEHAAAVFEERRRDDGRHVLLVEVRAHGTALLTSTEGDRVRERLFAFFDEVWRSRP